MPWLSNGGDEMEMIIGIVVGGVLTLASIVIGAALVSTSKKKEGDR